jgi:hypothetical protein
MLGRSPSTATSLIPPMTAFAQASLSCPLRSFKGSVRTSLLPTERNSGHFFFGQPLLRWIRYTDLLEQWSGFQDDRCCVLLRVRPRHQAQTGPNGPVRLPAGPNTRPRPHHPPAPISTAAPGPNHDRGAPAPPATRRPALPRYAG